MRLSAVNHYKCKNNKPFDSIGSKTFKNQKVYDIMETIRPKIMKKERIDEYNLGRTFWCFGVHDYIIC